MNAKWEDIETAIISYSEELCRPIWAWRENEPRTQFDHLDIREMAKHIAESLRRD